MRVLVFFDQEKNAGTHVTVLPKGLKNIVTRVTAFAEGPKTISTVRGTATFC